MDASFYKHGTVSPLDKKVYIREYHVGWLANWHDEHRNFVIFDLTGVTFNGPVTHAVLTLDRGWGESSDAGGETFSLFSVETPLSVFGAKTADVPYSDALWNDVGSGTPYGSIFIPSSSLITGPRVSVVLNAACVSAINQVRQQPDKKVGLGGRITSLAFGAISETLFGRLCPDCPTIGQRMTLTLESNLPPAISNLTATPNPVCANVPVTFAATASDPNNDPLTYIWNFGDGATQVYGSLVTHSYAASGTYIATVTVTDGKGGADSELIGVTILSDTQPPTLGDVAPIMAELTGSTGAVVTVPFPAVTDNCDPNPTVSFTTAPVVTVQSTTAASFTAVFPLGQTIVTFTATDHSSNTSQPKTTTVTVSDTKPPVISTVPPNISVYQETPDGTIVNFDMAKAHDDSGSVTVTAQPSSGSVFKVGDNTVTFTATDASGNSTTVTMTVTVIGVEFEFRGRQIVYVNSEGSTEAKNTQMIVKVKSPEGACFKDPVAGDWSVIPQTFCDLGTFVGTITPGSCPTEIGRMVSALKAGGKCTISVNVRVNLPNGKTFTGTLEKPYAALKFAQFPAEPWFYEDKNPREFRVSTVPITPSPGGPVDNPDLPSVTLARHDWTESGDTYTIVQLQGARDVSDIDIKAVKPSRSDTDFDTVQYRLGLNGRDLNGAVYTDFNGIQKLPVKIEGCKITGPKTAHICVTQSGKIEFDVRPPDGEVTIEEGAVILHGKPKLDGYQLTLTTKNLHLMSPGIDTHGEATIRVKYVSPKKDHSCHAEVQLTVNPVDSVVIEGGPADGLLCPGDGPYKLKARAYCGKTEIRGPEFEWRVIEGDAEVNNDGLLTLGTRTGAVTVFANIVPVGANRKYVSRPVNGERLFDIKPLVLIVDGDAGGTPQCVPLTLTASLYCGDKDVTRSPSTHFTWAGGPHGGGSATYTIFQGAVPPLEYDITVTGTHNGVRANPVRVHVAAKDCTLWEASRSHATMAFPVGNATFRVTFGTLIIRKKDTEEVTKLSYAGVSVKGEFSITLVSITELIHLINDALKNMEPTRFREILGSEGAKNAHDFMGQWVNNEDGTIMSKGNYSIVFSERDEIIPQVFPEFTFEVPAVEKLWVSEHIADLVRRLLIPYLGK